MLHINGSPVEYLYTPMVNKMCRIKRDEIMGIRKIKCWEFHINIWAAFLEVFTISFMQLATDSQIYHECWVAKMHVQRSTPLIISVLLEIWGPIQQKPPNGSWIWVLRKDIMQYWITVSKKNGLQLLTSHGPMSSKFHWASGTRDYWMSLCCWDPGLWIAILLIWWTNWPNRAPRRRAVSAWFIKRTICCFISSSHPIGEIELWREYLLGAFREHDGIRDLIHFSTHSFDIALI